MESALPTELRRRHGRARGRCRTCCSLVAALVFAMVVVGGITRLTESGLSITEWKPLSGAIPPLTHADWDRAFELYQATPEYREINGPAGMTLAAFKHIYCWELAAPPARPADRPGLRRRPRLVRGRSARFPRATAGSMVGLLALGGAQGALGWYMVMSGLADRTDVSHFRLSAHLLLALAIMGALIWVALDLRRLARRRRPASRLTGLGVATLAILFVQLLLGAWVAGLDAGQVANDWPPMQGRFFPDGIDWSRGACWALTNDPYPDPFPPPLVGVGRGRGAGRVRAHRCARVARRASIAIHSAFGTQILLGIATVLSGVAIWLAALHQAVGALLRRRHRVGRARGWEARA